MNLTVFPRDETKFIQRFGEESFEFLVKTLIKYPEDSLLYRRDKLFFKLLPYMETREGFLDFVHGWGVRLIENRKQTCRGLLESTMVEAWQNFTLDGEGQTEENFYLLFQLLVLHYVVIQQYLPRLYRV